MKRKSFIPVLILTVVSLLFAACDGGGPHITFTIDDVKYSWTEGLEGSLTLDETLIVYDGGAMGCVFPDTVDSLIMAAVDVPMVVADEVVTDDPLNSIMFQILDPAIGSYSLPDDKIYVSITISGNEYYSETGDTLDIEITSFGEVDGYITGTFSGTVTADIGGTNHTITNGKFKVKRIVDETFPIK